MFHCLVKYLLTIFSCSCSFLPEKTPLIHSTLECIVSHSPLPVEDGNEGASSFSSGLSLEDLSSSLLSLLSLASFCFLTRPVHAFLYTKDILSTFRLQARKTRFKESFFIFKWLLLWF